jgi:phenylalanyl-tRNA synthetase beta chain
MKIVFQHLLDRLSSKPSIDEVSDRLFQLGHEHEIHNNILEMEFTPNRGDCLSLNGLLRDLSIFYELNSNLPSYGKEIESLPINFVNNAKDACNRISFLKIDIDNILPYKNELNDYFKDLNLNKNNFFTDVSNYISYETGQPTHCYEASSLNNSLSLDFIKGKYTFKTLFDKDVELYGENLVFKNNEEIINLAGIVGGKKTSCTEKTRSVIVECAYFKPEEIIGKSLKYRIDSEAAHKFERGVDPMQHEKVLRRFLQVVDDHADILNVEISSENYNTPDRVLIPLNVDIINKILGTQLTLKYVISSLKSLGFLITSNVIEIPSYRSDIKTNNDIAEEIARVVGYDNIAVDEISIPFNSNRDVNMVEGKIKNLLVDNAFHEVINNPFIGVGSGNSIKVDNPLDSNRKFLRTNLKDSLIDNLLYNERRQKDSIKFFEVSDLYTLNSDKLIINRFIGIIASGRVGKNFRDFSKTIDNNYLHSIIGDYIPDQDLRFELISRDNLNTKLKMPITYIEINVNSIKSNILKYIPFTLAPSEFIRYEKISEFPSSSRDLSFSISDYSKLSDLQNLISNFQHPLLKEVFIFDYYKNDKINILKIAYRFIFQSYEKTITDKEVTEVINNLIIISTEIESISIPGLKV